jgi:hypothetical protein
VKIVASEAAVALIRERGGRLWVWLDPHTWVGGTTFTYLQSAFEQPGTSRATRRLRAARRPHRFHVFEGDGYEVHLAYGTFGPPEELHLEAKRWPKRRVDAYWNGAVFAGEDIPPPSGWRGTSPRERRARRGGGGQSSGVT